MTEQEKAYQKYISVMAEKNLHEKYSDDEITEMLKEERNAAYENAGLQDYSYDVGKAFADMSIEQTAGDRATDIIDSALQAVKSLSNDGEKINNSDAPAEVFMLLACIIELYGVRAVSHEIAWALSYALDRGLGEGLRDVFVRIANEIKN